MREITPAEGAMAAHVVHPHQASSAANDAGSPHGQQCLHAQHHPLPQTTLILWCPWPSLTQQFPKHFPKLSWTASNGSYYAHQPAKSCKCCAKITQSSKTRMPELGHYLQLCCLANARSKCLGTSSPAPDAALQLETDTLRRTLLWLFSR